MEWGGSYGDVLDVYTEPHLVLNLREQKDVEQLWRAWYEHGLRNVAPAQRSTAEAAVRELYAIADLPHPRFVWRESPLRDPGVLELGGFLGLPRVKWSSRYLRAVRTLSDELWCGEPVSSLLGGRGPVFDHRENFGNFCPPFGRKSRLEDCQRHWSRRVALWEVLSRSCGFWDPHRRACLMYERPAEVHVVAGPDGFLVHRLDGPALRYRDGKTLEVHFGKPPGFVEWTASDFS